MATTYDCIGSSASPIGSGTVTFSSIPSTYTDLVLIYTSQNGAGGTSNVGLRNSTWEGSNRVFWLDLSINTSGTLSIGRATGQNYYWAQQANNTNTGYTKVNIMNYASGANNVTFLVQGNAPGIWTHMQIGGSTTTNFGNSLTIFFESGSFADGSKVALYGIKAA